MIVKFYAVHRFHFFDMLSAKKPLPVPVIGMGEVLNVGKPEGYRLLFSKSLESGEHPIAAANSWWNDRCGDWILRIVFFLLFHSAEIRAHFVCQTGQTILSISRSGMPFICRYRSLKSAFIRSLS